MIRRLLRREGRAEPDGTGAIGLPSVELPERLQMLADHWRDEQNFEERFGAAAEYARKMSKHPLQYFVARLHNLGLRGGRILDAGCGTGTWSFAMKALFDEVCGADYVQERAELAQHMAATWEIDGMDFRTADVQDLPYPDDHFDAVFCFGVIIVPQTSVADSLREFKRIVRPGGQIYLCLNARGWAHYLASSDVPSRRDLGRDGIYMAVCKDAEPLVAALRESGSVDGLGSHESSLVAALRNEIAEYCGNDHVEHFDEDLERIADGRAERFTPRGRTYPNTYEPSEVESVARSLGLERFRWSHEGGLIEASDPVAVRSLYAPDFEGRTSVWECLMELPARA